MSLLDERPAARRGRRKSDAVPVAAAPAVPLPEWLDAPLLGSEDPVDGEFIDAAEAAPGGFLLDFHEGSGTASWLLIHAVAVTDAGVLVTCGRSPGVALPFPADHGVWVLRRPDAVRLAHAASVRVLRAWGEPEQSMQGFLRRCASVADLVRQWPFPDVAVADVVTTWELLRIADEANGLGTGVAA